MVENDGAALPGSVEERLSRVFGALSDPIRREMVARLAVGDATVGELAGRHGVTLQAISKHLRVLEEAGLVSRRREAQRRPAHLETTALDLTAAWLERYRRAAEERYERLDELLEALHHQPRSSSQEESHDHEPDDDRS